TSIAFILGLVPLVWASGAAMLARRAVSTPVFAGMIAASTIGIFLIPMLYVVFQRMREATHRKTGRGQHAHPDGHKPHGTAHKRRLSDRLEQWGRPATGAPFLFLIPIAGGWEGRFHENRHRRRRRGWVASGHPARAPHRPQEAPPGDAGGPFHHP